MNANFTSLLSGLSSESINAVNTAASKVSSSAVNAIDSEIITNISKYKKMAKPQRMKAFMNIISKYADMYPLNKSCGQRPRKQVFQFSKEGVFIQAFPSVQEAHRSTKIADSAICYCCNKKAGFKTAGGFIWSYTK